MKGREVRFLTMLLMVAVMASFAGPCLAQRAGAPKLGLDGLIGFRDQGSVAVLARATSYWRPVSTRSEELLGDFKYLPEYASARAQGQIFQLLESDASEWMGGEDVRFVAVPWSFGPGCAEEGWQAPEWVEPGDTVAFLLSPTRARSGKAGSLPVFDVLGWHQPYPVGELIPFWRKSPEKNPNWLTAQEFYQLLTVLPSELAFWNDPDDALAPARRWIAGTPGRDSFFPVVELVEHWEKRKRELAGTVPSPGLESWKPPSG